MFGLVLNFLNDSSFSFRMYSSKERDNVEADDYSIDPPLLDLCIYHFFHRIA